MNSSGPILRPLASNSLTLTEQTIEAVRDAIRNEMLLPGKLYSVYQLAEDLGVSRSPVRDALLRLAETGMVRFERNKGFRVVLPGPQELAEMISVRIALEVPAAGRAASAAGQGSDLGLRTECDAMQAAAATQNERLFRLHDQRLHAIILELAGNNYVRRIMENLRDATRLVGASTIRGARTLDQVYQEHSPIVDAIAAGDSAGASRAMDLHLRITGKVLLHDALSRDGLQSDEEILWERFIG